jgi:hypothetical protein
MGVPLIDYANLHAESRAALEVAVADQTTLGKALDWCRQHSPPLAVEDILTQDEYTHDVLVPYRSSLYLVYDAT